MSGLNCYIVSYDIMDEKRLHRVYKAMKGFGVPIHYSVFRCDLTPKGRVDMIVALEDLIEGDIDRVMIVNMGPVEGRVEERIEFLGAHPRDASLRKVIIA